jgi:hypothetical protein
MDPTPDPASDPGIFVSDLQDDNQKIFSSKTVGIKGFLTIFA